MPKLNILQKVSMSFMAFLVMLTFLGTNLHALLWQSSDWLVSTVLPAVVVDLTNDERADNQAVPLQRNSTLDQAAKLKAEHMAQNEYFSHFSPSGVSPWHWFQEAGYVYAHAGENLAIHFTDSSEVVDAWMKSPTHRQNIVNNQYTEIGVGTAKGKFDGYDTVYVVQLFGTPAVPPTKVTAAEPLAVANNTETNQDTGSDSTAEADSVVEASGIETKEQRVVAREDAAVLDAEVGQDMVTPEPELESEAEAKSEPASTSVLAEEADVVYEPTQTTESIFMATELEVSADENNIVVRSPVIATSSGLAIAQIETTSPTKNSSILASVATQPNTLLQVVYSFLALLVIGLLALSIVAGASRFNYYQVAHGFLLLFGMGGLWYVHTILTTGAVIG